jgi:hypothetical protein
MKVFSEFDILKAFHHIKHDTETDPRTWLMTFGGQTWKYEIYIVPVNGHSEWGKQRIPGPLEEKSLA